MLQIIIVGNAFQFILDYLFYLFFDTVVIFLNHFLHTVIPVLVCEIGNDRNLFVVALFMFYLYTIHYNLRMKNLLLDALVEVVGHRTDNMENSSGGRCGEQRNVCEQQRGTEFERTGETLADTEILNKRGLPIREETKKPRPANGGEDIQHADSPGCKEQHPPGEPDKQGFPGRGCHAGNVRHSTGKGFSDRTGEQMGGQGTQEQESERPDSHVSNTDNTTTARFGEYCWKSNAGAEAEKSGIGGSTEWSAEPGLGGVADGLPGWVDGYWDIEPDIPRTAQGIPHRVDRLKALGNAVVPQQFYPVFAAIAEVERMM